MSEKEAVSSVSHMATISRSSTAADSTWDKTNVPFEKHLQLCKDIDYVRGPEGRSHFRAFRNGAGSQALPDAPRIPLDSASKILEYCTKDLDTPDLNKMGEKLWWAGPTPGIVSLSQQTVLERRIQITEDPAVHLLWVEGILYVKPVPSYLTSYAFWDFLMDTTNGDISDEDRTRLIATCLGFLKTYSSLIQRRSDFVLAKKHDLLISLGNVSFEAFVAFIASFDNVPEHAISSRWRYGLIQLDALNFHSALQLRHWHLNRFEARWATYFSRFFPVLLFIFALLSVMLSAMQVIIGAKQMWETDNKGFRRVLGVFVWFGTEAIGWSLGFGAFLAIWWIAVMFNEVWHRRRMQKMTKRKLRTEGASP
jgi:hypothetical protein